MYPISTKFGRLSLGHLSMIPENFTFLSATILEIEGVNRFLVALCDRIYGPEYRLYIYNL